MWLALHGEPSISVAAIKAIWDRSEGRVPDASDPDAIDLPYLVAEAERIAEQCRHDRENDPDDRAPDRDELPGRKSP
jgi:hypothetical protein